MPSEHWNEFQYVFDLLQPAGSGQTDDDVRSYSSWHPAANLIDAFTNDSGLLAWLSAVDGPGYLTVPSRTGLDPRVVLNAVAQAIRNVSHISWFACPSVGRTSAEDDHSGKAKASICASLLAQMLTQQPRAFLHIQHLIPQLSDAMRSSMLSWRERCLWMCLRTLLSSPGVNVKYLFLHVACKEDVQILQDIHSLLEKTEAKVRMVLLAAPGITLGVEDRNVAHLQKPDDLLDSPADLNAAIPESSLFSASQGSNVLRKMQLSHAALERALLGTLQSFLPELGRHETLALTWIAFATRPISLQELGSAIAQDQAQQDELGGQGTEELAASDLVARLQVVFPGLLEIGSGNRVVLCISYSKICEILSEPLNSSLGEEWSPHLYLADTCLGSLKDATATAFNELATGFKVYAAQNWIHHYEMAKMSDKKLAIGKVLEDEAVIEFWLTFVAYLALPPFHRPENIEGDPLGFSSLQWQGLLDIKNLDNLKTIFSLARRPSRLPVSGRLLVDAAETSRQDILGALSPETLSTLPVESVVRALAASQGAFHDNLKKNADFLDEEAMSRVRLTALVLGNTTERDSFVAELSSPSSVAWQDGHRFADLMSAALEYDDKVILEKALELGDWDAISGGNDSLIALDSNGSSTLHVAAEHGSLEVSLKILKSRHEDEIGALALGPQSPVFIAASHGFYHVVEQLLSVGMFVDSVEETSGRTALHIASWLGCYQTVDVLLQKGADVTLFDDAGDYPLHLAIRHGNARIAEQLLGKFPIVPQHSPAPDREGSVVSILDHASPGGGDDDGTNVDMVSGAALNRANLKGVSILAEATSHNMPQLCATALDRGADVNLVDDDGRIALHLAARSGSVTMVRDLLSKGSETNQATQIDNCIPIHYACYRGFTEVVDLLAGVSDLFARNGWDWTPLSAAAAAGHLDVVRTLYGHYDDLGKVRALVAAAEQGQRGVVEYLLDSGCPVDGAGTGESRLIPLLKFEPSEDSMVMRLLLGRGANPDLVDENDRRGYTAIYTAASDGVYEAVKLLLDHGAKTDVETGEGETPLSAAIYWEHPNVVRLLLQRNTRMRVPAWRHRYRTLLDFALGLSTTAVVAVLIDFYAKGKHEDGLTPAKALVSAMRRSRIHIVELILNCWLFVPGLATESSKADAIHAATTRENVEALRLLVQHPTMKNAVNLKSSDGLELGTPLHKAMLWGQESAVEILIEAGADPNIVCGRFGTTLCAACASGSIDMVKKALDLVSPEIFKAAGAEKGAPFQWVMRGGFKNSPSEIIAVLKLLEASQTRAEEVLVTDASSSPVHHAVDSGVSLEVIDWLLEKSSGEGLLDYDVAGRIPLSIAVLRARDWEFIEAMKERSIQAVMGRSEPVADTWPQWIFTLLDALDLNLLHYAVLSQSTDTFNRLLERIKEENVLGEVLDAPDIDGWTSLHWACRGKNDEIVKLLVDNGANTTARAGNLWTPRHVAILHGNESSDYLVQLPDTGDSADNADSADVLPEEPILRDGGYCDWCFFVRSTPNLFHLSQFIT